jgi:CRISPR/Cas system-associated exonuclease Cas4 (RecB family)
MRLDEFLLTTLNKYSDSRPRSQQTQVGVSQIGGCRRQVWHQLQGAERENATLQLPALMGTAIHQLIQDAFVDSVEEEMEDYWVETELEYDGIKGHVDFYLPKLGAVIDWKTTKMRNLAYFPSQQQRWQVQLYAWLIEKVHNEKPLTVSLVAIPRDGDERNIKIHTEEYNPSIAEEAIAWYRNVASMTEPPAPERYAAQFCQHYCSYFGKACQGKGKEKAEVTITDKPTIQLIERYIEVTNDIKRLDEEKDSLKAFLEGVEGVTPEGVKVSWSQIAGRKVLDEEAVAQFLTKHGESIPYKQGMASMRLSVK